MGCDKARIEHRGWPMGVHLCGLMEQAGLNAHLVRRGGADGLPWRMPDGRAVAVVRESSSSERHPLQGVVTALDHAGEEVVVIPCDLPCLTVEALQRLDRAGVAAGHPLVARVPFGWLETLREAVQNGTSATEALARLPRLELPPGTLVDRNEPGSLPASTLTAAERLARGILLPEER